MKVKSSGVSLFVVESRNILVEISNIRDDDKADSFCAGLKPMMRSTALERI